MESSFWVRRECPQGGWNSTFRIVFLLSKRLDFVRAVSSIFRRCHIGKKIYLSAFSLLVPLGTAFLEHILISYINDGGKE